MKASELADFFEFEIECVDKINISSLNTFVFGDLNSDGTFTGFRVKDLQGCFRDRYIKDIESLVDCFDSMLDDYIFNDFEETLNKYGIDEQVSELRDIVTLCDKYPLLKEFYGQKYYSFISDFVNCVVENDINDERS